MKPTIALISLSIFIVGNLYTCKNEGNGQTANSIISEIKDSIILTENLKDTALVDSLSSFKLGITLSPQSNYNDLKKQVNRKRLEFYSSYQKSNDSAKAKLIEEAGNYIFDQLLNKIIPFWYKTSWCLSGYSNIPREGTVGCSYFVSNTLVACGFKLNRYRLAQTDPIAGSRSLTFSDSLIQFKQTGSLAVLANEILKKHGDGLYIIGLDTHTGYLLIHQSKLYFIHSAYYYPNAVCLEYFEKSIGILGSTNYYLTPITSNKKLLEKWILNDSIFIQKPVYLKVDETRWNKQ
jgi:hypothetical protein